MQTEHDAIDHSTQADADDRAATRAKSAAPYPYRPMHSSRIPPSDEGPYRGLRRRGPSLTTKLLVWGGIGVVTAAATAAAILATRRPEDEHRDRPALMASGPRPLAPRFAEMDDEAREAVRRRDRERALRERNRIARMRALAARERVAPRRNAAREMADTASSLSGSLNGLVGSLTSAMAGFRQVAGQAGGILREFSDAADVARDFLDRPQRAAPTRDDADSAARPADHGRRHRL